jgi:hypothetical protein
MQPSPAESVASIVTRCQGADFTRELMASDDRFEVPAFESDLAEYLRSHPELMDRWLAWSADQRWMPSAYVRGTETGWYDSGYRNVVQHPDTSAAVSDFIRRMAAWLAANRVVVPRDPAE